MTEGREYTVFYVLRGLVNGQRGEEAHVSGPPDSLVLTDGHWVLFEGEEDPSHTHPFDCHQDAVEYAEAELAVRDLTQTWVFPLDGSDPHRATEGESEYLSDALDDANFATITRVHEADGKSHFLAKVEGSYEVLDLRMTAPSHEAVADVYRQLLIASRGYQ